MDCACPDFDDVVRFHGHLCPGVTIGYRAALIGMEGVGATRAPDEELVTIVENDACGVDAVQVMTGCTVGKGNLILRDFGKNAWTFINRTNGKAVRVASRGDVSMDTLDPEFHPLRGKVRSGEATQEEREAYVHHLHALCEAIKTRPAEEIFLIHEVAPEVPERARIFRSYICAKCGEQVSEARARLVDGEVLCMPCAGEYTRGW